MNFVTPGRISVGITTVWSRFTKTSTVWPAAAELALAAVTVEPAISPAAIVPSAVPSTDKRRKVI